MAKTRHSQKKDGRSAETVSSPKGRGARSDTRGLRGFTAAQRRGHERALARAVRSGPKSLAELFQGVRRLRRQKTKALLYAHHALENAVERSLLGSGLDPVVRFDLAFHTAEILADAVHYLVDFEPALRGRRLPAKRLLALADNAVWHWPTYHVPELKKLLSSLP